MVVLISIFAHNLSLTHSFKKQRIDSVQRSVTCTSACLDSVLSATGSHQVLLFAMPQISERGFADGCRRPRGCRRVPAQTPGLRVLLQGRAAWEAGKDRLQISPKGNGFTSACSEELSLRLPPRPDVRLLANMLTC